MSESAIVLPTGVMPYNRCQIHPMVIFNVLDHHIRRPDGDRVIGVLLGNITEDNVVEIRNCFPVPHSEGETISMNIEYYRKMAGLHQRLSPEDIVVGWYTTGDNVRQSAVLFQKFFRRDMNQEPIHLMVGTDMNKGSININTFYSLPITLNNNIVHNHFLPLPFDYVTSEHERAAFDVLDGTKSGQVESLSELGHLEKALHKLYENLEVLHAHISDVIEGKIPQNPELGRFLQHTLSLLPTNDISFDTMFSNGTLDTLMLIYLANLTRSHLFLAEKTREQSS